MIASRVPTPARARWGAVCTPATQKRAPACFCPQEASHHGQVLFEQPRDVKALQVKCSGRCLCHCRCHPWQAGSGHVGSAVSRDGRGAQPRLLNAAGTGRPGPGAVASTDQVVSSCPGGRRWPQLACVLVNGVFRNAASLYPPSSDWCRQRHLTCEWRR